MEIKFVFKVLLAIFMVFAGAWHFVRPEFYLRMIPAYLPNPQVLVWMSGFFEILGGIGLLIPQTSKYAAWGLVALFVAVFPANWHMAINAIPYEEGQSIWVAWVRLPFQVVFIAWALWFTK